MPSRLIEYRPAFAPHVAGLYPPRQWDETDGRYLDQKVEMLCGVCGGTARATCSSGQPRSWVVRFALSHLHRDPLDPATPPALEAAAKETT